MCSAHGEFKINPDFDSEADQKLKEKLNKEEKMAEDVIKDRPSSIKVSQNAKSQYSFEVKIYFSCEKEERPIERVEEIYNELHKKFKGGK